ncbi:MAG: signal recognition particle protein [Rubrobacteridae bacterium]|nr:signal recognition particle protein [Rubrobacteridae bacterium]
MFDSLSNRLQDIMGKLRSRGVLTEKDVDVAMREVRLALLEADVNYKVVKEFIAKVKERSIGSEVMESLTPGQHVIKIVNEELTSLMGATESKITFSSKPPTIIMLVGLQGSGKTTTSAKLAHHLRSQGRRPFLIGADVYRPAAIDQLKTLAEENKISFYSDDPKTPPLNIVKAGIKAANLNGSDVVIVDTAGRLHIDDQMMKELEDIKSEIRPHQILLVVDAMTGQDAVNVSQTFSEKLNFDGVVMTKLDGDARGGAALSVKAVTGKPIKLVSIGEKMDSLEPFHPDRMASRILGMGDMLTLIEKAQFAVDEKKAREMEDKLRKAEFTFEDFLDQMEQMKKMGPINQIMGMIPGMGKMPKDMQVSDKDVNRIRAIIQSMTSEERRNPNIISGSRRERIAKGSGTNPHEVNQLLKQFAQTKKLLKQFSGMQGKMKMPKSGFPFFG